MRQQFKASALLIVLVSYQGCASDDSRATGTGGATALGAGHPATQIGGSSNGGASSYGGNGGKAQTGKAAGTCPSWPRQQLLPLVGPLFFGSDPGPCNQEEIDIASGAQTRSWTYTYSATGVLEKSEETDIVDGSSTVTTYEYDAQGRLSREITSPETTNYQHTDAVIEATSSSGWNVRYNLDADGYITTAVSTSANGATLGTATYTYENCHVVAMTYVLSNGTTSSTSGYSAYTYDSEDHLVSRENSTSRWMFDYSCWP